MPKGAIHWGRVIRGTQTIWLHCGRPLLSMRWTRNTTLVTCAICRRYIVKGEAAGYTSSNTDTIHETER